jgi:hypothetical protein
MKYFAAFMFFFSLTAQASPFISVKDRLRLHMWVYGLEQDSPSKPLKVKMKPLPEEIARALKKI